MLWARENARGSYVGGEGGAVRTGARLELGTWKGWFGFGVGHVVVGLGSHGLELRMGMGSV